MGNFSSGLTQNADFRRGFKAGLALGVTFIAIFSGYAIAAIQKGLEPALTFLFTVIVFAAPAQYAVVDMIGSGAALWQLILVGILMNVRFFIMSLTMSHFVRQVPLKKLLPWTYFVAASPFLLALFDKRKNRDADFLKFFIGVVCAGLPLTYAGTLLGIVVQSGLPPLLTFAALLFFPVYFTVLIVGDVKKRLEIFTVLASFFLAPFIELAMPGWGIILSALVAATAAIGIHKWIRKAD